MPEKRLQKTRDAYRPLTSAQVIDALMAAPWLPYRLSCGCRRQHASVEDPSAPDMFTCDMHQRMALQWLSDNPQSKWRPMQVVDSRQYPFRGPNWEALSWRPPSETTDKQAQATSAAYRITVAQRAFDKAEYDTDRDPGDESPWAV